MSRAALDGDPPVVDPFADVKSRGPFGKTEKRLAFVILVTAMLPLVAALFLAGSMFRQGSALWYNPEIGIELDRGVELYKDYVRVIKEGFRHVAEALASDERLREAARKKRKDAIAVHLGTVLPRFAELVSLRVDDADGQLLAERDRGRPVDDKRERSLEVRRPLTEDGATLVATFAVDRKRLDELEAAGAVVARYHQLAASREKLYDGYLTSFTVLLGVTMLLTLVLGILLARGVTRRINRLALAINLVAEGDLSVRVPVTGSDELTELARTFNRMLGEMAQSRARIEFLQRMGAWQEMAQRLAHEIKNPLTPIQLAVQECHRKYAGEDPKFRALLDATLEIVEEEVGTLRRLVSNFSSFARLPHAELAPANLQDFLRECSDTLAHLEDITSEDDGETKDEKKVDASVDIAWRVPTEALPVRIDRQMFRRVVVNLVRNAGHAIRDARAPAEGAVRGHIEVIARREGGHIDVEVHDDGPGVPDEFKTRIFDPYFTTKTDGTGLGLAIVKKIVVEHGGAIEVQKSERLGGAKFVVTLPDPEHLALMAAEREARDRSLRIENIVTDRDASRPRL